MTRSHLDPLVRNMGRFLDGPVNLLLRAAPFEQWPFSESTETDLDEPVREFVFDGHGLELQCSLNGSVKVIFLHSEEYAGFDEAISGVSFSLDREPIIARFGLPSKSGGMVRDSVLGDCGAWDRFEVAGMTIHFEYKVQSCGINKITLMSNDVVP